jgi:hypothetical protein
VTALRNFPTHRPPVYRAARRVGRMWFVPIDLSENATVACVPRNSVP